MTDIVERLLCSEEHACEEAIPQVAYDAVDEIRGLRRRLTWQSMATAPLDGTPIIGLCRHEANPYHVGDRLTTYGAHNEGLGHAEDGPHVLVWGGEYDETCFETGRRDFIPDWWFLSGSDFEVVANPIGWMPLPEEK